MSRTGIYDSTIGVISHLLLILGEGILAPSDVFHSSSSMFTSIDTEIGKTVSDLDGLMSPLMPIPLKTSPTSFTRKQ